ncbi:multidrug effflux MFS transporter, partial [Parapusillimonas sp. SGNA-6]|nr:multidrug effflux MFS transporter [Parapusillimonas sp. SGNA-6]
MKANKNITLLILGLLSAIGPFSIDMYLPAFDTIATDFNTSVDKVQLSLTSYFVGIAIGQMIYGPLLDKFGRKKPLMIGLIIYALASILCV